MAADMDGFSRMLRAALGDKLAVLAESFVEMVADDVVMEFPFSPAGLPQRLEGRAAIAAHLVALGRLVEFDRMELARVYATSDPGTTIIEFEGFGRGARTGTPYDQRYISVITTEAGLITYYRDYWNPLVLARALTGAAVDEALDLSGVYER